MAIYRATIEWSLKDGEDFANGRYRRGHTVTFAAHVVPATASAHVVGNKWAAPGAVDPEEMFVAAEELRFEYAARLRDEIAELRREIRDAG